MPCLSFSTKSIRNFFCCSNFTSFSLKTGACSASLDRASNLESRYNKRSNVAWLILGLTSRRFELFARSLTFLHRARSHFSGPQATDTDRMDLSFENAKPAVAALFMPLSATCCQRARLWIRIIIIDLYGRALLDLFALAHQSG